MTERLTDEQLREMNQYQHWDYGRAVTELLELREENERLHSWGGLMELLDEHWPEDIVPTLEDDVYRDTGARIVSLIRWVERLRKSDELHAQACTAYQEYVDVLNARPAGNWIKDEGGALLSKKES
jgi:hypothetical protein